MFSVWRQVSAEEIAEHYETASSASTPDESCHDATKKQLRDGVLVSDCADDLYNGQPPAAGKMCRLGRLHLARGQAQRLTDRMVGCA